VTPQEKCLVVVVDDYGAGRSARKPDDVVVKAIAARNLDVIEPYFNPITSEDWAASVRDPSHELLRFALVRL
jgi:hypothetical protein